MISHLSRRVTVKEAIEVLAHHFELQEGMIWGFLFTGAAAELHARQQMAEHSDVVLPRPSITPSSPPSNESIRDKICPTCKEHFFDKSRSNSWICCHGKYCRSNRLFDSTGKPKPGFGEILLQLTTEAGENAAGAGGSECPG